MSANNVDCIVLNKRESTWKGNKSKKSFGGFQKELIMEILKTGNKHKNIDIKLFQKVLFS
jgi:hypothetical protein